MTRLVPLVAALAALPLLVPAVRAGSPGMPREASRADSDQAAREDLVERLADLGSVSGAERARAERWLGVHVARDDFALLVQAARVGDAEVRGRLARAVGSDDRHLGLAARFLALPEPALTRVGEEAVRRIAGRWNIALARPAWTGVALREHLVELAKRGRPQALILDYDLSVEDQLDLLRRHGRAPMGLVTAPGLRPFAPTERALSEVPTTGTWAELLEGLAHVRGVGLEGHGLDPEGEIPRGFVHLSPALEEGTRSGLELLVEWCTELAGGTPTERSQAARALASCGWPAALDWLEELWRLEDDALALDGLLLAAANGRRHPRLSEPDVVRALVARGSAALAASSEAQRVLGRRVAFAYAGEGCVAPDGRPLSPVILEGWDEADGSGRFLRLRLIETQGCRGEGIEVARACTDEVLADGDADPDLVLQALRTWAALRAGAAAEESPAVPALAARTLPALVGNAKTPEGARELLQRLVRVGAEPPADWRDPQAARAALENDAAAELVAVWWVRAGATEVAAAHLIAAVERESSSLARMADLLHDAVLAGERRDVLAAFEAARDGADAARLARLDRLAFVARALAQERHEPLREDLEPAREDPLVLGILAGVGESREAGMARLELLRRMQEALEGVRGPDHHAELVEGAGRALEELYGGSREREAELYWARLTRLLASGAQSPLGRHLVRLRWPWPPRARPLDPSADDRRLFGGRGPR